MIIWIIWWLFVFDYLIIILIISALIICDYSPLIIWWLFWLFCDELFDDYCDYLSFDYLWLFAFNYLMIIWIIWAYYLWLFDNYSYWIICIIWWLFDDYLIPAPTAGRSASFIPESLWTARLGDDNMLLWSYISLRTSQHAARHRLAEL